MIWTIRNDAPIYAQLMDQMTRGIVSGVYQPGERLPSVRELAAQAGVNPNTMQRALTELEREGLVFSQRTTGRFVTEETSMIHQARTTLAQVQIQRFLEAMGQLGFEKEEVLTLLQNQEMPKIETDDGEEGNACPC